MTHYPEIGKLAKCLMPYELQSLFHRKVAEENGGYMPTYLVSSTGWAKNRTVFLTVCDSRVSLCLNILWAISVIALILIMKFK